MSGSPASRIALLLTGSLLSACGLFSGPPGDITETTRMQPIGPGGLTPADIQSQVMGFADTYQALTSEAWDRVRLHDEITPIQRAGAVGLKVRMISGVYSVAITANPVVALMDMVVLVELQREIINDYWVPEEFGDAGSPLVEPFELLHEDVWQLADNVFDEEQQQEIRTLLEAWWEEHPDQAYVSYVRIADFAEKRQESMIASQSSSSILSLVQLDPLAGLDPAELRSHRYDLLAPADPARRSPGRRSRHSSHLPPCHRMSRTVPGTFFSSDASLHE